MKQFEGSFKTLVLLSISVMVSCQPKSETQELRARVQSSVPEGWVEQPYIENAPEPVLSQTEAQRGFMLFSRPAIEAVYKNTNPLPHERLELLKAFATPGEFEPLTLSIYPSIELKNVRLTVSDIKSGDHTIDKSNLDLRLVTYWNMHYPTWETKGTYRNVPELLEKVTVNDMKSDECQRYWINVHVPENAKPGIYEGKVSISHDGLKEAISVPIKFRVLDFKLKKDPNKHYTAYFSGPERQYRGMTGQLYETAVNNELQAMLDYGFDMTPTLNLSYDGKRIIFSDKNEKLLEKMLDMGFSGPIPIGGDGVIVSMLDKHEGIPRKSHWKLDKFPSNEFYTIVKKAFTEFRIAWEKKERPDFYLNPVDEVDATAREFGVKVYKAVKEAGIKTYITKESTDKGAGAYSEFVDAWCSQPYDVSYETAVSGDFQFWSYPNHNAGERKDRPIMLKGGRMTYGFGFWRSGFTVLIPWHWRWITSDDQFEYIRPNSSPCGMRMDEEGNIIPAIYWESFREGYDDLRYVYTLQQAIEERRGSDECVELISESEKYLQEIWSSIKVQHLYLKSDMWPSEEFNMIRWKMAGYISALLKYPAVVSVTAPSVLESIEKLPTSVKSDEKTQLTKLISEGKMEILDLTEDNYFRWTNEAGIGSMQIIEYGGIDKTSSMKFTILVDHEKEDDESGWPNVGIEFEKDMLDFSSFDYLYFLVNISSNRDKTGAKATPFNIGFKTFDDKIQAGVQRDLGNIQGQWISVAVSIPELLNASFYDRQYWKELQYIKLGISKWRLKYYKHGTELNFNFGKVYLLKLKEPVIEEVVVPRYVDIYQKWIPVDLIGYGFEAAKRKGYNIQLTLNNSEGQNLASMETPFYNDTSIILDISNINETGKYQLNVVILSESGEKVSNIDEDIQIISIYL